MQVVILAGGSGTRLWPISTDTYPKQFIKFTSHSFYQRALLLANAIGGEISVVTVEKYRAFVEEQAKEVGCNLAEVIIEPAARGTCPAIGLACRRILERAGNEPTLILPSDHHIGKFDKLAEVILQIDSKDLHSNIYLFGVCPKEEIDASQYGWIKLDTNETNPVRTVDNFIEKPNEPPPSASNFVINAGIFYFTPLFVFHKMATHAENCFLASYDNRRYVEMINVSFDRKVLSKGEIDKKCINISHVDWSDMGSFAALREYFPEIEEEFDHFRLQPKKEHPISTNIVQKPWGWYENLTSGPGYLVKILHINPNSRLSDQFHKNRKEVWIPLGEGGTVERNSLLGNAKVTTSLKKWVAVEVDALRRHRLQNSNSGEPLEVLEIQVGEPDENDIVRLEDDYGRIDEPVDNA